MREQKLSRLMFLASRLEFLNRYQPFFWKKARDVVDARCKMIWGHAILMFIVERAEIKIEIARLTRELCQA